MFTSINGCREAVDVRASFLFVGDLNGHHHEWLCSTTTNRHGVAAFDFVTVSGYDQLVVRDGGRIWGGVAAGEGD